MDQLIRVVEGKQKQRTSNPNLAQWTRSLNFELVEAAATAFLVENNLLFKSDQTSLNIVNKRLGLMFKGLISNIDIEAAIPASMYNPPYNKVSTFL